MEKSKGFKVGDLVVHLEHPNLGVGKILKSDGGICIIEFENRTGNNRPPAKNEHGWITHFSTMSKYYKHYKEPIRRFTEEDPFGEEDWSETNESMKEFKKGDMCIYDGNKTGMKGKLVRILYNCGTSNEMGLYEVEFIEPSKYKQFTCLDYFLEPVTKNYLTKLKELEKKREEIRAKNVDIDPFGEEEWLEEKNKNFMKNIKSRDEFLNEGFYEWMMKKNDADDDTAETGAFVIGGLVQFFHFINMNNWWHLVVYFIGAFLMSPAIIGSFRGIFRDLYVKIKSNKWSLIKTDKRYLHALELIRKNPDIESQLKNIKIDLVRCVKNDDRQGVANNVNKMFILSKKLKYREQLPSTFELSDAEEELLKNKEASIKKVDPFGEEDWSEN